MRLFLKVSIMILFISINTFGQEDNKLYPFPQNGKWGYINSAGKIIVPPKYESASDFSEGLAKISTYDDKRELLYGFINMQGREIIPPKFLSVSDFHGGVAQVNIRGKFAYLLPSGTIASSAVYDAIFPIVESVSRFKRDDLFGYASAQGKEIIPAAFLDAYDFQNGLALVKTLVGRNALYGYIDKKGIFTIAPQYKNARSFSENLAAVSDGRSWFVIDKLGTVITTKSYDYIGDFKNGLARVKRGNLWGYINKNGELIIPTVYKNADDFYHGLAIVSQNNLFGYINTQGELIAPFVFTRAARFDGTFARVSQNHQHGFMNAEGKYNLTDKISSIGSFFYDRARMKVNKYIGYFDNLAKVVIKPSFLQASDFKGELAITLSAIPGGFRSAYINKQGVPVKSWNIVSKPVPQDKDILYVIAYPSIPFYKESDPASRVIIRMDYGAELEKTFQRTAVPVIGHGLSGLLYTAKFYSRPGFVFSEAVSFYSPPKPGMGIYPYFRDHFGIISETGSPYTFATSINTAFFNGAVMTRMINKNMVQDTYVIPFMKLNEAFFLFSSALGYPVSEYPNKNGTLPNYLGNRYEARFYGKSDNENKPTMFSINIGSEKIIVSNQNNGLIMIHDYPKPSSIKGVLPEIVDPIFKSDTKIDNKTVLETNEVLSNISSLEYTNHQDIIVEEKDTIVLSNIVESNN